MRPESRLSIQTSALVILGQVVTVVARKPYEDYVREQILIPQTPPFLILKF